MNISSSQHWHNGVDTHFQTQQNVPQRMSSREIAELASSRHDNVKITIDRLVTKGVISQPAMQDGTKAGNGVVVQEYLICKRDSFIREEDLLK